MDRSLLSTTILALLTLSSAGIAAPADIKPYVKGDLGALTISANNQREPSTQILDATGKQTTLAEINASHKLMVVDLWASWCGGCKQEMPTFAKMQAAYAGRILVIPVSMDVPKDREKARAFLAQFSSLPFYQNPANPWPPAITTALTPKVGSFPTAIIFVGSGKEIGRMVGKTADWNGHDTHALFDYLLSHQV